MKLLKPKINRGAVSKSKVTPSRRVIPWRHLLPVFLFLVLALLLAIVYQSGSWLLSQPINTVTVTGQLRYVDKKSVVHDVEPFLEQGFISLDLSAIRAELKKLPWVFDVRIKRQWPNNIVVEIVEQQAIAQWGKKGFLNHRGELFSPRVVPKINELPRLNGPINSTVAVMQNYRSLSGLLRDNNLVLEQLTLGERGDWVALLRTGAQIKLGHDQIMEKMKRFIYVYQIDLADHFSDVNEIDMRYNNGFALAWNTPLTDKEQLMKSSKRSTTRRDG